MVLFLSPTDTGDRLHKKLPLGFFCRQLLLAGGRQAIKAGPLIVLRQAPLRLDPTFARRSR